MSLVAEETSRRGKLACMWEDGVCFGINATTGEERIEMAFGLQERCGGRQRHGGNTQMIPRSMGNVSKERS